MEGGGFAAARPSIVRKEIGGALAWNQGHLPFKAKEYYVKKIWDDESHIILQIHKNKELYRHGYRTKVI